MNIESILQQAVKDQASDIFLIAGRPVSIRKNGTICSMGDKRLLPADTETLISQLYTLAEDRVLVPLYNSGDDDFSFSIKGLSRFRVNAFKQRGALSAVIRIIQFTLPDSKELHIPDAIMDLTNYRKGLILVTGSAGSGKSTTLACIIDKINHSKESHIITLEDPIEFLHRHDKCIVTQREIQTDSLSYVTALRASLRQSPDIILLGEMRDYETIEVAMSAAETGHLIFSTLHTIGAANTIERIIDVFPANQQRQIAVQLAMVLNAVVSQQLVPTVDGRMIPVFEIMTITPAIRTMIRDNKVHQIDGVIYASSKEDMISMDSSLYQLYKEGVITKETALTHATNPEMLERKLR